MGSVCRVLLAVSLLWNLSALGQQPKPLLPDPKLTPGDVFGVTIQDICVPGYSKRVRAVPRSLRKQAYAQYGITSANEEDYQMDHLIPLSLGGSNSIRNLWPESYHTTLWNAHVKDVLEVRLHNLVCNGKVDLQTAQHEIATDWIKAYQKYFAESPPRSHIQAAQFAPDPTDPYGLQRMERVKTDIGLERLCNQLFREWDVGEPTRAELRAERKEERGDNRSSRRNRSIGTLIVIQQFGNAAHVLPEPGVRRAGKALVLFCPAR